MTKQMSRAELNALLATTHASIKRIETGRNLGLTIDDWERIQRDAKRKLTATKRKARLEAERLEGLRILAGGFESWLQSKCVTYVLADFLI